MKYSIQETTRTVTVESVETDVASLERAEQVVRSLVKPVSWRERATALLNAPADEGSCYLDGYPPLKEPAAEESPDPLDGITYPETPSYLMAAE